MIRLHGTSVAVKGMAVLLIGPPGAGKSDLALRLIDRGALLVADDQVDIARIRAGLVASPPSAIAGKLEVRGLGIITMPFARSVPLILLVDLASCPERLPLPVSRELLRVSVPLLALSPFEASAPLKLERAVALARSAALWAADAET